MCVPTCCASVSESIKWVSCSLKLRTKVSMWNLLGSSHSAPAQGVTNAVGGSWTLCCVLSWPTRQRAQENLPQLCSRESMKWLRRSEVKAGQTVGRAAFFPRLSWLPDAPLPGTVLMVCQDCLSGPHSRQMPTKALALKFLSQPLER